MAYDTQIAFGAITVNINRVEAEIENVKENADYINANKNYIDITIRKAYRVVKFNGNVTKCPNCAGRLDKGLGNCHIGCSYDNGPEKQKCWAMNSNGYCNICGCAWNNHINTHDYMEPYDETVRTTNV